MFCSFIGSIFSQHCAIEQEDIFVLWFFNRFGCQTDNHETSRQPLYSTKMNNFKAIGFILFLLGCNSPGASINSNSFYHKAGELFFKADVKGEYDELVRFFNNVEALEEFESGWTLYPPLSALGQQHSDRETKNFEFNTYLNIGDQLEGGRLSVERIKSAKEVGPILEIVLEFKTIEDAEAFYKRVFSDFNTFQIIHEKPYSENTSWAVIRDIGSESVLRVGLFTDNSSKFYATTLRLIMDES